jgi:phosphate transport system permease protein
MSNVSGRSVKEAVARGIARRYRNERIFRTLGFLALLVGLGFLAFFFYTLIGNGYTAVRQTRVALDVHLDPAVIDPAGARSPETLRSADYQRVAREALGALFPDVTSRGDLRALYALLSAGAGLELQQLVLDDPNVIGETRTLWLLADDDVDVIVKGHAPRDVPESDRRIDDRQLGWLAALEAQGRVDLQFNRYFFTRGDSRDPELAGIWGATVGSFFMLLVTLALSFPLGVATAMRSTSTTSRPCLPSCSAYWGSRCSSTFSGCRARHP